MLLVWMLPSIRLLGWMLPFMLLLGWVLPFILLLDMDDALYLAGSGNTYINTTYVRGTAAIFLPPYILHAASAPFRPHAPPSSLADLSQVVLSGDEAVLTRRLRSSTRPRRGRYESDHSSCSESHDSKQRESPGTEAADGGNSEGWPKHSPTSREPRTAPLEEEPQQRTGTDAGLPSLGSEAHQRQPLTGSVERQRLVSPRSAVSPLQDSSHGRDARDDSLNATDEAAQTQGALEETTATTLRRRKRLQQIHRDIAAAESAERKAVAAARTAQEALQRDKRTAASGVTANPSPPMRQQSVYTMGKRPGDNAFFHGSMVCMALTPRQEFPPELGASISEKASPLLQSVKKTSLQEAELLSVAKALSDMGNSSYLGQKKATPTLALVFALRVAHDAISHTHYGRPRRRVRRNADAGRDEAIVTIGENVTTVGAVALGEAVTVGWQPPPPSWG